MMLLGLLGNVPVAWRNLLALGLIILTLIGLAFTLGVMLMRDRVWRTLEEKGLMRMALS